jgi:hypothetical protein
MKKFNSFSLFLSSNQQKPSTVEPIQQLQPRNLKTVSSLAVSQGLKDKKIEKDSLSPFLLSIHSSILLFLLFLQLLLSVQVSERERKKIEND